MKQNDKSQGFPWLLPLPPTNLALLAAVPGQPRIRPIADLGVTAVRESPVGVAVDIDSLD